VKSIKGHCHAGHQVGDRIELSTRITTEGICGWFYHDMFPYIVMLQFGGAFPETWDRNPDIVTVECIDKRNAVKIELHREK